MNIEHRTSNIECWMERWRSRSWRSDVGKRATKYPL